MTYRDNAAPEPLRCPRDRGVLELRDDVLPRLVCVVCDGVWLRVADAIALATREDVRTKLADSVDLMPKYLRDESRLLHCPRCHERMDRYQYGEGSRVAVDACLQHGLWLDVLELAQVAAYLQHHARPVAPARAGLEALRGPARTERSSETMPDSNGDDLTELGDVVLLIAAIFVD